MGRVLRYFPRNTPVSERWAGSESESIGCDMPFMMCTGLDSTCITTCPARERESCARWVGAMASEQADKFNGQMHNVAERLGNLEASITRDTENKARRQEQQAQFEAMCIPQTADMCKLTERMVPLTTFRNKTLKELGDVQKKLHCTELFLRSMCQYVELCAKVGAEIPRYAQVLYLNVSVDGKLDEVIPPEGALTAEVRRALNAAAQMGIVSIIALRFTRRDENLFFTHDITRRYQDVVSLYLQDLGFLHIADTDVFKGEYHYGTSVRSADSYQQSRDFDNGLRADMGRYYYTGKTPDALAMRIPLLQRSAVLTVIKERMNR